MLMKRRSLCRKVILVSSAADAGRNDKVEGLCRRGIVRAVGEEDFCTLRS